LLAVNSNQEAQSKKVLTDLQSTFSAKRHLFEQKLVTFQPNTEGAPVQVEAQSDIQTSVHKELGWAADIFERSIDTGYQIDVANTMARADIVTEGGDVIAKSVPATSLLQLEKELKEFRDLLQTVPTLDPAKGFSPDTDKGKGVYRARVVNKVRTKKTATPVVLYPATDKHPAQVQLVQEDIPVGNIQEQEWSALLTPATKSDLIDRVETLTRAVKKARSRANEVEIQPAETKIGKKLLEFVLKPLA